MKLFIPLLVASSMLTSANAVLLLTIDAGAKTVSWSGSFTTADIVSTGFDFPEFYLANTLTSNPNPSPLQTIAGADGTLSSVPTGFTGGPTAFQNLSSGQINITENISLISVWIAQVFDFDPENYTFTTSVADGSAISYSGINSASQTFLESLDGTSLDLVRRGDNAPTPSIIGISGGGPAANITVVPEPSSFLLGAIGSLALLRRRR